MKIWGLMIMSDEKFFAASLGSVDGLGNKSIARLVKFFGSAKTAWSAGRNDLKGAGLKSKVIDSLENFRRNHSDVPEKLAEYCRRHGIQLCSFFDDDFPPILKEIPSPPMYFYYRGKLQPHAQRVAIVGTRNNTAYGQNVATELANEFAAAGLTVVSGAARGIDSFAHFGALKSGRTVAVLGCGLDYAFTDSKRTLLEKIAENGVVLSEFNLPVTPTAGTLAARNRIIAGLCNSLVVVEAGKKSGALIAADDAFKFGRKVFVVPGEIHSEASAGCFRLIRNGAELITGANDVLERIVNA